MEERWRLQPSQEGNESLVHAWERYRPRSYHDSTSTISLGIKVHSMKLRGEHKDQEAKREPRARNSERIIQRESTEERDQKSGMT